LAVATSQITTEASSLAVTTKAPVGRIFDPIDPSGVALEFFDRSPCREIPLDGEGILTGAEQETSVSREARTRNPVGVPLQRGDQLTRLHVPQANRVVAGTGRQ